MATLEITTKIGCPLVCTFCPQDKLMAAYDRNAERVMSVNTFERIIERVPKHVRIHFSGLVEPWSNPDATLMLKITLEKDRRVAIYTTLFGMSVEDSISIRKMFKKHAEQISHVCIHLPDRQMNMRGYKGSSTYRTVLKNFLQTFEDAVLPKQKLQLITMDSSASGRVHNDISDIVINLSPWKGHTRGGNIDGVTAEKIGALATPHNDFSLYCGRTVFYDHNVVLPNGDVTLCCMDYALKHVIGNILATDYWDIFSSPVLQRLRTLNQKPEFSRESLCKSCSTARLAPPNWEPS